MPLTLNVDPISFIRVIDMPVRDTMVQSVTISGWSGPHLVTITKVGGAAWLSVPATCYRDVPFDVEVLLAGLPPEYVYKPIRYTETLLFERAGQDDLSVVVTIVTKPGGPPAK